MRECDTCVYSEEIDKGIIEECPGADSELTKCPYYIRMQTSETLEETSYMM